MDERTEYGASPVEPSPADVKAGHELSDVTIRPLMMFLAGLTASLVVISLVVAWLFGAFIRQAERADGSAAQVASGDETPTPGPLLQVSPRGDVVRLREREQARLTTVEWVDEQAKIVRMPIARAMELIAEHGVPDWPKVDPAELTPQAASENPSREESPRESEGDAEP